ncbi:YrzK family protein [Bacillus swezeyi]|uniref:YrzK family protein n=1 Tax=Bacillus swezeyi TaxID=1925020 RepID=UPI0027DDCFF8|nr:YrzK family protein [Bacillus swezeyi]
MRYNQRMGKAIHEQNANMHLKDHSDPEHIGFLEETATELGLTSKESIKNKKNRN